MLCLAAYGVLLIRRHILKLPLEICIATVVSTGIYTVFFSQPLELILNLNESHIKEPPYLILQFNVSIPAPEKNVFFTINVKNPDQHDACWFIIFNGRTGFRFTSCRSGIVAVAVAVFTVVFSSKMFWCFVLHRTTTARSRTSTSFNLLRGQD